MSIIIFQFIWILKYHNQYQNMNMDIEISLWILKYQCEYQISISLSILKYQHLYLNIWILEYGY